MPGLPGSVRLMPDLTRRLGLMPDLTWSIWPGLALRPDRRHGAHDPERCEPLLGFCVPCVTQRIECWLVRQVCLPALALAVLRRILRFRLTPAPSSPGHGYRYRQHSGQTANRRRAARAVKTQYLRYNWLPAPATSPGLTGGSQRTTGSRATPRQLEPAASR